MGWHPIPDEPAECESGTTMTEEEAREERRRYRTQVVLRMMFGDD